MSGEEIARVPVIAMGVLGSLGDLVDTRTYESLSMRVCAMVGIDPSHTENLFFALSSTDG